MEDGLASNTVLAITQARDGSLWLGTGSGLSHFRNGSFTNYATAKARNGYGPRVDWVHEDAAGTLWLGSAGYGLGRLREGQIFWAGTTQGLNDNVVYSGLEAGGDLWLSTNRGIGRISKAQFDALADGRIGRIGVHVYDTTDGLRSNECSGDTQPSAWKRGLGELVFACLGGAGRSSIPPAAQRGLRAGHPHRGGQDQWTTGNPAVRRAALPAGRWKGGIHLHGDRFRLPTADSVPLLSGWRRPELGGRRRAAHRLLHQHSAGQIHLPRGR